MMNQDEGTLCLVEQENILQRNPFQVIAKLLLNVEEGKMGLPRALQLNWHILVFLMKTPSVQITLLPLYLLNLSNKMGFEPLAGSNGPCIQQFHIYLFYFSLLIVIVPVRLFTDGLSAILQGDLMLMSPGQWQPQRSIKDLAISSNRLLISSNCCF